MKKSYTLCVAAGIILLGGASITATQAINYGSKGPTPAMQDAESVAQNIALMWRRLDAIVTAERQAATDFETNSPEELLASSAVCTEAGRFFQLAKDQAHAAITHEQTSGEVKDGELAKDPAQK